MQTVKDSVNYQRNRLEQAFGSLESAIDNYIRANIQSSHRQLQEMEAELLQTKQQVRRNYSSAYNNGAPVAQQPQQQTAQQPAQQQPSPAAGEAETLRQIQEVIKSHEQRIIELREETGRLSVELVRIKDENRALKEQSKQAANLIGESIIVMEKLVAA